MVVRNQAFVVTTTSQVLFIHRLHSLQNITSLTHFSDLQQLLQQKSHIRHHIHPINIGYFCNSLFLHSFSLAPNDTDDRTDDTDDKYS